jgi:hypothetical protein
MSILSNKASFAIAAAVVGAMSLVSFGASAGPLTLKKPCIGCTPNTWTPGGHHNHWDGGGYGYGGGLSINFAQPQAMDEGDCYYVRRRVFIPGVGVVAKRQMVCN